MKQPIGPALPGTRQVLLAFNEGNIRNREAGGRFVEQYSEMVQIAFLPKGLLLWGAKDDTLVHSIKVGNMTEAEISGAPIPGRYFEQGRSFEEIQRLAAAGELDLAVEARQQLDMSEAYPGVMISVALSGSYERFCVWGVTYANGQPFRRASIEPTERAGFFSGRLDEYGLGSIRSVLEVSAPDARVAAELLIGLSRQNGRQF